MLESRPPLTAEQILTWADAHQARTGRRPHAISGPIPEAPGESWMGINSALYQGHRGLPGGSSLSALLDEYRGSHAWSKKPSLSVGQVLAWAKAHRQRTGWWPNAGSGSVPEAPGQTWAAINAALDRGFRGLPGGDSLARLLRRYQEREDDRARRRTHRARNGRPDRRGARGGTAHP